MSPSNTVKQATALKYQLDKEGSAPIVVASGMGVVAQKIVDVALQNNVPIFEDDSLAALLSQLQVGKEIPPQLFQAVVDIYVYFLNFTIDGNHSEKPNVIKAAAPAMASGGAVAQNLGESIKPLAEPLSENVADVDEDDDDDFRPF